MSTPKAYRELVAQAALAVSEVKDAELKRVAFEKILDDLLNLAGASTRKVNPPPGPREVPKAASKGKAQPVPTKRASGPQGYVEDMISDGFFQKPKSIAEVKAELGNRGHHIPVTSLSGPLQRLCKKRTLRRQKTEGTYSYSRW